MTNSIILKNLVEEHGKFRLSTGHPWCDAENLTINLAEEKLIINGELEFSTYEHRNLDAYQWMLISEITNQVIEQQIIEEPGCKDYLELMYRSLFDPDLCFQK
jgi:hypothetical protein